MIIEIGRLVNDVRPDTIESESGAFKVLNNRIAIYQGKERTTFVDITAWGDCAAFIYAHFEKGDEIYIEGEIRNKPYSVGDKTIQTCFIRVAYVKPVFGKKRTVEAAESE
jgi:single-stranded DNA-binding protein